MRDALSQHPVDKLVRIWLLLSDDVAAATAKLLNIQVDNLMHRNERPVVSSLSQPTEAPPLRRREQSCIKAASNSSPMHRSAKNSVNEDIVTKASPQTRLCNCICLLSYRIYQGVSTTTSIKLWHCSPHWASLKALWCLFVIGSCRPKARSRELQCGLTNIRSEIKERRLIF